VTANGCASGQLVTRQLLEVIMTSAHTLSGMAMKVVYFSLTAIVFVFVFTLLIGVHP
jgi:hypothetical protein